MLMAVATWWRDEIDLDDGTVWMGVAMNDGGIEGVSVGGADDTLESICFEGLSISAPMSVNASDNDCA